VNVRYLVHIIDDDAKTLASYFEALRGSNDFAVQVFRSMEDADAAAGTRSPHILLADVRLDFTAEGRCKDATEYLAEIRAGNTNFDRRVPVVLFTGQFPTLEAETFKRAVALGAKALLLKDQDIAPETAENVLKQVLDEARTDDEVIAALERAKKLTGAQAFPIQGTSGATGKEITIDDVIKHLELNDEFARRFRAGLMSIVLAMLKGSSPKQT
jgi:DNA-binding NtrC family response regulator